MNLTNNNLPRNGNNRFYSPTIIIDVTETKRKKKEREGFLAGGVTNDGLSFVKENIKG